MESYIPAGQFFQRGGEERSELIESYFHLSFRYTEILLFLGLHHGIFLSLRHLKRLLKSMGLGRRRNPSDIRDVCQAIEEELRGSGSCIGYSQMAQRLVNEHRLVVGGETVRELLKIIDREGVEKRLRHRLKRRQYQTKGPNYLWHIDGYDKLKPFGFCIHGAIDGYSRRILWLEIGSTNNDPSVIAQYYIDCIRQIGGTAKLITADRGTENVNVAILQRFFRREGEDSRAGDDSFIYGKSVSNQRIELLEAWWGILRKGCSDWWINYFKDMRDCGLYSYDDCIQVECLKFCFMQLLRDELHQIARLWNVHQIRPSLNAESPDGRPDVLFFIPEVANARSYKVKVDLDELDMCCRRLPENSCLEEFTELAITIMHENNLDMPRTGEEATRLYAKLTEEIDKL